MPDSLMSWGHSSMLYNVKKLFKKGPSSPSSKDKHSSSIDNYSRGPSSNDSSSNGQSNSRGRLGTHSSNGDAGHQGRESGANGHLGSPGTHKHRNHISDRGAGGQDNISSSGHSSISQLFPTSPRNMKTGFDDYYASQNMSPRPSSPAPLGCSKSDTKPMTDPLLKVMQVLGVTKDELSDNTKVDVVDYSGSPDDDYDIETGSEDEESITDAPHGPSLPIHRPPQGSIGT